MSSESPAVILYSSDGYELAAISGSATPANTRGLLVEGSDGTNSRFLTVDTSGRVVIVGAAASGAAAAGNPLYTAGLATTAAPAYTTATVNPLSLDLTGNLRVTGAGGTFPVTGTVTATNSANSNTGAAPPAQATYIGALATTAAESGLTTGDMYPLNLTTTGQLRVDGVYPTATAVATAVDMGLAGGVVTTAAPTYTTATANALSLDTAGNLRTLASQSGTWTVGLAPGSNAVDGYVTTAAPAYTNNTQNFLSLTTVGNLRVDGSSVTQPVTGTGTAGTPATGVVTIQGITGGTAIPVSGSLNIDKSSTGTMTSVAAATSSTTLLASNANRVSASFYNDGSSMLFLALSATAASQTAFTIRVLPNSYIDLPINYTGQINGIWNGTNGSVRITEWT